MWSIIQGFGSYWTLVAALDLDVFDEIQRVGPTRIEPLATKLSASAEHLAHLCDALVTFGFLDQLDDVLDAEVNGGLVVARGL